MRVLVCGGRDYREWMTVWDTLTELSETNPIHIINGGAEGADNAASGWAKANSKPCTVYPADWNSHGKRAGYLRNQQMLVEGNPDLVIAFPGGKGTEMMIKLAKEAGVEVREVITQDAPPSP